MVTRRTRVLAGTTLLLAVLVMTGVPTAAAADCTLSAPEYINVGTELAIEGSGFPASSSIDVDLTIEGGASDAFSVQSDADGALQIALVPEDIDIGVTTVQATSGSACTASVTYTVLAAGATPPLAPTEVPESGTGGEPPAPQTDAETGSAADRPATSLPMILALLLAGIGSAGLVLTRSPRRR